MKKGKLAFSDSCVVLITGPGRKNVGYNCFSGVLICVTDKEDIEWKPGMYSDTWTTDAFKVSDIKIQDIVIPHFKPHQL